MFAWEPRAGSVSGATLSYAPVSSLTPVRLPGRRDDDDGRGQAGRDGRGGGQGRGRGGGLIGVSGLPPRPRPDAWPAPSPTEVIPSGWVRGGRRRLRGGWGGRVGMAWACGGAVAEVEDACDGGTTTIPRPPGRSA